MLPSALHVNSADFTPPVQPAAHSIVHLFPVPAASKCMALHSGGGGFTSCGLDGTGASPHDTATPHARTGVDQSTALASVSKYSRGMNLSGEKSYQGN